MEFISSQTASDDATIDFTDLSSSYQSYVVIVTGLVFASDSVNFQMQTSTDNGSNFDDGASDYSYILRSTDMHTTETEDNQGDDAHTVIVLAKQLGNDTNEVGNFRVEIHDPAASIHTKVTCHGTYEDADGIHRHVYSSGVRLSAADVDAIRFKAGTGNISSGSFFLYGIPTS